MPRRAARIDNNQREIVDHARSMGATVQSLAGVGKGVPDLLISLDGRVYLVEVKGPKGKLTEDQHRWHAKWQAPIHIVRTCDDMTRVLLS